jgi:hypothetical protein
MASIVDHNIDPSKGLKGPIGCGVGSHQVGDIELEQKHQDLSRNVFLSLSIPAWRRNVLDLSIV